MSNFYKHRHVTTKKANLNCNGKCHCQNLVKCGKAINKAFFYVAKKQAAALILK
jgi:hypothetical protein